MDSLVKPQIVRLDRRLAREFAPSLIALSDDTFWDSWDEQNLLEDRPGKWECSLAALGAEEQPIAYAIVSLRPNSSHLHHMIVGEAHRGRGLGRTLVERWIEEGRGFHHRFTLKVHPDNVSAMRFYQGLGFTNRGRSSSGYQQFERNERGSE